MRCSRCHGLMVEDYSLEVYSDDDTPIDAWRCLNCGDIVDAVIALNRRAGYHTSAQATCNAPSDSPGFLWLLSVTISFLGAMLGDGVGRVHGQEPEEGPLGVPYVCVFLVRSQPIGANYFYKEDQIPSLAIGGGTGGGAKVGVFLRPFNYMAGAEIEGFAHDGKLSAPQTTSGGVTRFARQDFTMVNVMGNVLLRYRGDVIQPYVGGGLGLAFVFTDGEAQSRGGRQSGSHGLSGVAAQAIAGARLIVTQHIFMFAEYKYLVSSTNLDHCGSEEEKRKNPDCRVLNELHDFQSHYAGAGIGFSF